MKRAVGGRAGQRGSTARLLVRAGFVQNTALECRVAPFRVALDLNNCLKRRIAPRGSLSQMSKRFEGTADYVATDDLKIAVNAAIALERPLLIKGEPCLLYT